MIQANQLHKTYSATGPVIAGISLSVGPGQILAVVGRSGCGKSTLLNVLAGLETADSGTVQLGGRLGYLTQDTLLLPWRTALENVLLPLELRQSITPQCRTKALELMRLLGIGDASTRFPEALSGGMRQRVAIARTLLHDASVLLLDEPCSALDFDLRLKIGQLIRRWVRANQKALLVVTHQIDEAIAISDEVAVISGLPAGIALRIPIALEEDERAPARLRQSEFVRQIAEQALAALADADSNSVGQVDLGECDVP